MRPDLSCLPIDKTIPISRTIPHHPGRQTQRQASSLDSAALFILQLAGVVAALAFFYGLIAFAYAMQMEAPV